MGAPFLLSAILMTSSCPSPAVPDPTETKGSAPASRSCPDIKDHLSACRFLVSWPSPIVSTSRWLQVDQRTVGVDLDRQSWTTRWCPHVLLS
ncbi:hypothetical protein CCHR01_08596 [Colletotrichum chrysophilum]|uniref:Secreted protein n=1 Tax=Colletotrichum chrysophilum TaxID=1836956 RepID=A0AAD9AJ86_9PEZI|nr:hypothetical protein CCHR01_08596 [Colletotrichum chrysophilum]